MVDLWQITLSCFPRFTFVSGGYLEINISSFSFNIRDTNWPKGKSFTSLKWTVCLGTWMRQLFFFLQQILITQNNDSLNVVSQLSLNIVMRVCIFIVKKYWSRYILAENNLSFIFRSLTLWRYFLKFILKVI